MRLRAATAPSESGAQRRAFVIERGGLCRPFFTSGSRTRALRSVDQGGLDFLRPVAAVGWWLVLVGRSGKAGPGWPVPLDLGGRPAGRLRCAARSCGPACNSLRSLRSLRSGPAESEVEARALRALAASPALLAASHARHRPPRAGFAPAWWRAHRWRATDGGWRGGRYPPRVSRSRREAEEPGGARAARLDIKTPGECLSESERSERSELPRGRPGLSIAAQSARSGDRRSPNPWRVPPAARARSRWGRR
jgi:hypothetical protein